MPTDRRVRRTQTALQDALIALILEKGFEAVTVSEITERADVGRSTFYAHYADKEDLLQGSLETLRALLESHMDIAAASDSEAHPALRFCSPMLEHANENRPLFAALLGRQAGYFVLELVHDIWCDLIRASVPESDEVVVQSVAGAFGSTLMWWLTTQPELSAEDLDKRFRLAMRPVLEATAAE